MIEEPNNAGAAAPAKPEQMVRIVELRRPGHCATCGNDVNWAVTLAGKNMPLEAGSRVTSLFTRDRLVRVTVFTATKDGAAPRTAKTAEEAERLRAKGWSVLDELFEVWEIPASLTHWANCKTAYAHRRPARQR